LEGRDFPNKPKDKTFTRVLELETARID